MGKRLPIYVLHIDDTGSRHLDKLVARPNEHPQWFALGGMLVKQEDEQTCKVMHSSLYARWPKMNGPLHLTDMRARRGGFSWLEGESPDSQKAYWKDYETFLSSLPVIGMACVIHRPGYLARGYGSRTGDAKWNLCRSAFGIVVERAAKFAHARGHRLRVEYEGSNKEADHALRGYFALLKSGIGVGFNPASSAGYQTLDQASVAMTLIDMERKDKKSRLMQIADSYVYAIAKEKYDPSFGLSVALRSSGRFIEHHLMETEEDRTHGIKYYCF
ncbi:hypothetical protein HN018_19455 [Lichenicola cladoniae]|uniref:DUF3800 domain-containing protein n=1 Tax=Lichenicola cladoniae TaxID=1484109 RepID=A0A6M8HTR9_9PROT|nr:hypothetical protein [Lichenicola cladoniae]NPD70445.1 hypothetical protein [Acetobacteraceae bacterium]QKE91919.1 hypothetical protein HN018_19455 [Lichenicola cladoniae]